MTTPASPSPTRGTAWGICLVSFAILLQQVALTRLLSVVLWYHYAFLAISLAMLGLALSGIALYLSPGLLQASRWLMPWYARGAALTMPIAIWIAVGIASNLEGDGVSGAVVALYLAMLVPFTCAGFAVSATLALYPRSIGRLYGADLVGAAAACLIAVPLLDSLGAPSTLLVGSLAACAGAFAYGATSARRWRVDAIVSVGVLSLLGWQFVSAPLEPTSMHGVPDVKPAGPPDFVGWNSHSRIVVAPTSEWSKSINIDGHATTGIYRLDEQVTPAAVKKQMGWMPIKAGSMPYFALNKQAKALIIGPGGGLDIINGVFYSAQITAIELNGLIYDLMSEGEIASWAGHVYRAPGVRVVHDEARSWIRRSNEQFDLIQASMIDTWAATASGAFALAENSLYTVEAFEDYWDHLSDDGMVHFLRWHEDPPRQSLRVLALITEVMTRRGVPDPHRHLVVLKEPHSSGGPTPMASIMWSKEPFSEERLRRMRKHVKRRQRHGDVRVLCWPGEEHPNALSGYINSASKSEFLADYPYETGPTTDDRPFFFHTAAKKPELAVGNANEQAIGVLWTVLYLVGVITIIAFVGPLGWSLMRRRLGHPGNAVLRLGYFACLGIGFMMVEIPLLQRFGLYIGHPAWALSLVLGSLLLGAGIGGASTNRIGAERVRTQLAFSLIAILAVLGCVIGLLDDVLAITLKWSFLVRSMLTILVLVPIGVVLGRVLPLGVRMLGTKHAYLIPWAWSMNGATSVLASVMAVLVGVEFGFSAALLSGVGCYAVALGLALVRDR